MFPESGSQGVGPPPVVPGTVGVLVPVKAFDAAKGRLAEALGPDARARLARRMAAIVVAAAHPLPVAVACDDDRVAEWARSVGAEVVRVDGPGLNRAVETGVAALGGAGFDRVVVAHADLPRARRLDHCAATGGITLVPDRHLDGTPVLVVPPDAGFRFAYGPGSYAAHVAEAERLGRTGVAWRSLHDPDLAWDVDDPADLAGADLEGADLEGARLAGTAQSAD